MPGIETHEVDKTFTIPTQALYSLERDKVGAVWVDPKEPHNLDKIVLQRKVRGERRKLSQLRLAMGTICDKVPLQVIADSI